MGTFVKIYISTDPTPTPIGTIMIQSGTRITFIDDPDDEQILKFVESIRKTEWLWVSDKILLRRTPEVASYPLKRVKFILSEHGEVLWEDPSCRKSVA